MQGVEYSFDCPYCGEPGEVTIEPTDEPGEQSYVEDCGVCCRPWAIRVRVDADGEVSVNVDRA